MRIFRIRPAAARDRRKLWGWAVCCAGIGLVCAAMAAAPDFVDTWWAVAIMALTSLVALVAAGLFAIDARAAHRMRAELTPDALRLVGSPYGRRIPRTMLCTSKARVVGPDEDEYVPRTRVNGLRLGAVEMGWFAMKAAKRVLVFKTGPYAALFVPTTEGYALLVTVERAGDLLDALRKRSSCV